MITDAISKLLNAEVTKAYGKGYTTGRAEGFAEAADQAEEERAGLREAAYDGFTSAARDAHFQARHSGSWDHCTDPVCAAIERWLHFESKEVASA